MTSGPLIRQVTVTNRQGIHARPAHAIVVLASRYKSEIELIREGEHADAKSILAILTLAAAQGSQLTIKATGDDAGEALQALTELIINGFGENGSQPMENQSTASEQPYC